MKSAKLLLRRNIVFCDETLQWIDLLNSYTPLESFDHVTVYRAINSL